MTEAHVYISPLANAKLSVADRLQCGWLSVDEVCALRRVSRTRFYEDVRAGLVTTQKHGRSTRISGPIAAKYIALAPVTTAAE
jgi:hypothetical protein